MSYSNEPRTIRNTDFSSDKRDLIERVVRVVKPGLHLPKLSPSSVTCRITRTGIVMVRPAPHAPDNKEEECEIWEIEGLPDCMVARYRIWDPTLTLFCRPCYPVVYDLIKAKVTSKVHGPILVTGIPGIGKSMFSIYFLLRAMTDKDFPVKDFLLEYEVGRFHHCFLDGDVPTEQDGIREFQITTNKFATFVANYMTGFLITDMTKSTCSALTAIWHCIFSSPNPERYKEHMKFTNSRQFTMPAWSLEEMVHLEIPLEQCKDAFEKCGGVPGLAVMTQEIYLRELSEALAQQGADLMENFVKGGFNIVCPSPDHLLTHNDPLALSEAPWWKFEGLCKHTFASEYIRTLLYERHMIDRIDDVQNGLVATQTARSHNVFARLVLCFEPIHEVPLVFTSLVSGERICLTLPEMVPLPSTCENSLMPGKTYVAEYGLFRSGSEYISFLIGQAFCVIEDSHGKFILVFVQTTIWGDHSIRQNILRAVLNMYTSEVRATLSHKYLAFVTHAASNLKRVQPILEEDDQGCGFQQIVHRHNE